MVSPNLALSAAWNVWEDTLGSDHFPVITSLGVAIPISKCTSHKYNLKNISWISFSSCLTDFIEESKLSSTYPHLNVLDNYNLFVKDIDEAITIATPHLKKNPLRLIK